MILKGELSISHAVLELGEMGLKSLTLMSQPICPQLVCSTWVGHYNYNPTNAIPILYFQETNICTVYLLK